MSNSFTYRSNGYKAKLISTIVDINAALSAVGGYKAKLISTIVDGVCK